MPNLCIEARASGFRSSSITLIFTNVVKRSGILDATKIIADMIIMSDISIL